MSTESGAGLKAALDSTRVTGAALPRLLWWADAQSRHSVESGLGLDYRYL